MTNEVDNIFSSVVWRTINYSVSFLNGFWMHMLRGGIEEAIGDWWSLWRTLPKNWHIDWEISYINFIRHGWCPCAILGASWSVGNLCRVWFDSWRFLGCIVCCEDLLWCITCHLWVHIEGYLIKWNWACWGLCDIETCIFTKMFF